MPSHFNSALWSSRLLSQLERGATTSEDSQSNESTTSSSTEHTYDRFIELSRRNVEEYTRRQEDAQARIQAQTAHMEQLRQMLDDCSLDEDEQAELVAERATSVPRYTLVDELVAPLTSTRDREVSQTSEEEGEFSISFKNNMIGMLSE